MAENLVGYSRAGDVFHYRWSARRCLKLIYPNSTIQVIGIEGSPPEENKAGEYVIDVSEYSVAKNGDKLISYYQLKHTTVQKDDPFTLSDLKDSFIGFAERFIQHKNDGVISLSNISFTIITNRKIADTFKQNLISIVQKKAVNSRFKSTLEVYTNLKSDDLASFCATIRLEDSEGDYNLQKDELKVELSQLLAGSIDNAQIDSLISLVQEKVLPDSNGEIKREDVLMRFGITSERDLYPAPAVWEELESIIEREQYNSIRDSIIESANPIIVHAAGGVGKSVFCKQVVNTLADDSVAIAYDCFGAGGYRSQSGSRHRHRDALVQITNELASKGLCSPLIVQDSALDENIMRKFLICIEAAVKSLKKNSSSAQLLILIDAADNAEMAAAERNQSCFAHELLKESMPDGCKLVLLCRTERISLLQPPSNIQTLELSEFSAVETTENLKKRFPNATDNDGIEFHRLTGGNPRVQANSLDVNYETVQELLTSLGPSGCSVEQQIESQLKAAVSKIKDLLPQDYQKQIDSICLGLASLPPNIPLSILAKAADVSVDAVKSFISEIGRSLWLSDASVQFRDEPTETWFRKNFSATLQNYSKYISSLEPIANESSYVAEVLPQLYLQAGEYEKLIRVALSDEYLPLDNPIDARNIRVQRLQFAFKAALKSQQLKDAIKLALRAGEEMAGDQRQLSLLQKNIDLIPLLQGKEKVQEIAFKRLLYGSWDGSENVYSASLLSGISDYRGEARGYLRSSLNWLDIFFEKKRRTKSRHDEEDLSEADLMELAYTHLNIFNVKNCYDFLASFRPKNFVFIVVQSLIKKLIDNGRLEEIKEFLRFSERNSYFTIAASGELMKAGIIPDESEIKSCLNLLNSSKKRLEAPHYPYDKALTSAIIYFLEACLCRNLPASKILAALNYYIPIKASPMVYNDHFSTERTMFLQALAIRAILSGESTINIEEIYPVQFSEKKRYDLDQNVKQLTEVIDGLLPWFMLRINVLLYGNTIDILTAAQNANTASQKGRANRYSRYDTLPNEVADICGSILTFCSSCLSQEQVTEFYNAYLSNNKAFRLDGKLKLLYALCRNGSLIEIKQELESAIYEFIRTNSDSPEETSGQYIELARAVLVSSIDDARVYFDEAVKVVSKFGDEISQRWGAVVSLAKRSSKDGCVDNELAYRFVRCAELVGENVAREKYWNRSEAMRVCTKMSPGIGLSALSRWRDRGIGRFEYEFEAVLLELIESKVISPAVGWSLTRFFSDQEHNRILSRCLENEPSTQIKQNILNDAVFLFQIEGANKEQWSSLNDIAEKYSLNKKDLINAVSYYGTQSVDKEDTVYDDLGLEKKSSDRWGEMFQGLVITTADGFEELMRRFNTAQTSDEFKWTLRGLLCEVLNRLDAAAINYEFIDTILQSDHIDFYDAQFIISHLPQEWTNKVSFKRRWKDIIFSIGKRYASNLTNRYAFDYATKEFYLNDDLVQIVKNGILAGLESTTELTDADSFFGFVELSAPSVERNEAIELTDYALSRFEMHIEDDFGDGVWSNWLNVNNNICNNVAGFIWSALGSPRSFERWNATHCVRKLAYFGCSEILDELISWLDFDKVGAFGRKQFPFYNLHARQYLLMAFARISIDSPELLVKYSSVFSKYALSESHVLIQKHASDCALNIEQAIKGTYSEDELGAINAICQRGRSTISEEYNYLTNSYWHEKGEIDTGIDYYFGHDFDSYWYEPLGRVFGLPGNQIEELAADVIINKWGIKEKGGYYNDPRSTLWEHSSSERETWHDHGSYPKTDNLDFYRSYHAMLVVAAHLVDRMPVIRTRDWPENQWDYWLSSHTLVRHDGKWLSDSRSALPLKRPRWIHEEKTDTWRNDISSEDFIDCLKAECEQEIWLNVKGEWHEKLNERTETFSISSALVAKSTSGSLLIALSTCKDPYNFSLPYFGDNDTEIKTGAFVLKGWIEGRSSSHGLDKADPYAAEIAYPPYSLGIDIVEQLKLATDNDGLVWLNENGVISLICEAWCSSKPERDEESDQSGIRLKASLSLLKELCLVLNCDIIFAVYINRDVYHRYGTDNYESTKPKHEIFILSSDGRLRTTEKDYKLG